MRRLKSTLVPLVPLVLGLAGACSVADLTAGWDRPRENAGAAGLAGEEGGSTGLGGAAGGAGGTIGLELVLGTHYALHNVGTGKCLDLDGLVGSLGTQYVTGACVAGSTTQGFSIQLATNATYQIVNTQSGRCLDLPTATGFTPGVGTRIQQFDCHPQPNQQFLKQQSSGGWRFISVSTGFCLEDSGTDNGNKLVLGVCREEARQLWRTGSSPQDPAQVLINGAGRQQTMTGFGVGTFFTGNGVPASTYDVLFDPTQGIGLSVIRTRIDPSGDIASGAAPVQAAWQRGVRQVFAVALSPPPAYQSNSSAAGGTLKPDRYADYAAFLVDYIKGMKSQYGVEVYAIAPANDPLAQTTFESALWTGETLRDFTKDALASALKGSSLQTKVVLPEAHGWNEIAALTDPCLADAACKGRLDAVSTHGYSGTPASYSNGASASKPLWMTEAAAFDAWDASMPNALHWAHEVHNALTSGGVSAWLFRSARGTDNTALVNSGTEEVAKRAWAIGNYSRFVRPGSVRLEAPVNPSPSVYLTAFQDATSVTVVAINEGSLGVAIQGRFNRLGVGTLVPWVTSGTGNLVAQEPIPVQADAFSAYLAPTSVTTLVGGCDRTLSHRFA